MGLPLDTTAAQPKLKLYRYVSPLSLPLSFSLSLAPCYPLPSSSRRALSLCSSEPGLSVSLPLCIFTFPFLFLFPSPSARFPGCFSFSPLPRLSSYIRGAIVNGLQPLPGIYPRNLPSATSVSPLALARLIPRNPSRGSTDCAL